MWNAQLAKDKNKKVKADTKPLVFMTLLPEKEDSQYQRYSDP